MAPEAPTHRQAPTDAPGSDCPCCKRGGWMRDLPPQAYAVDLESPPQAVFDLSATCEPELRVGAPGLSVPREATGPPAALRPHASPVGCVRLLT